jgi:hypothetical protein
MRRVLRPCLRLAAAEWSAAPAAAHARCFAAGAAATAPPQQTPPPEDAGARRCQAHTDSTSGAARLRS